MVGRASIFTYPCVRGGKQGITLPGVKMALPTTALKCGLAQRACAQRRKNRTHLRAERRGPALGRARRAPSSIKRRPFPPKVLWESSTSERFSVHHHQGLIPVGGAVRRSDALTSSFPHLFPHKDYLADSSERCLFCQLWLLTLRMDALTIFCILFVTICVLCALLSMCSTQLPALP